MRNAFLMAILKGSHHLFEYSLGILLFQPLRLLIANVRVQAAPSHVLHHEIHILISLERLKYLDDIGMVHLLQEADLSPHRSLSVGICELGLVIDFNSKLLATALACCNAHDCIGTLADLLAQGVAGKFAVAVT